jgi:branched-chain amino acid transport system substrate-binding protein
VIVALAAERAKSTKGVDITSEINGITRDGEKCTTFRQCRDIIDSGGNPDYIGVTGEHVAPTLGDERACLGRGDNEPRAA